MSTSKNKNRDLLSFFPVVNRDPPPGVRRPLNLRTPPVRKKPSTAGRTNPLPAVEIAESSDRLRRLRPRSIAMARLPATSKVPVATPGKREAREEPLTVEDIWRPGAGPPEITCHEDDRCKLCLHLISHPVFYTCGHGHCYACCRMWLDWQWTCPQCEVVMTRPPFRNTVVELFIRRIYGDWDTSSVDYDWSGLEFPVVPSAG
ncbi:hypothetical protein C8F04DRAFT_1196685 [Mycena alexandri]|uniref:RING-type domain-containing protein n=1 Tax=Mycena alexandri TaxID=1745969 RepID=A0AAD6S5S0_9AGAR|nr:hypothetical protein C8F04DRAFT_1196685 [Mycena alexandri]